MPQNRPDSVITLTGFPPLVPHVPANWPTRPSPNKLSLLWQYNNHELYHKFSPYTNYHDSLLSHVLSNKQPFVYKFIDEADKTTFNQLPSTVKSLASAVNINQDTIDDVVRVSKFLVSSWGVQFLAKQVLIQRLQSFDETRIFNPLSPLLPTLAPFALGLGQPPLRHIEGGLLGLANSVTQVVGINLQTSYATPKSTAGAGALSDYNTGEGKGLIRGADASKGFAQLKVAWPVTTGPSTTTGGITGMLSMIGAAATQVFGYSPKQPAGTIFRADETTYTMMAISPRLDINQSWFPTSQTRADQPRQATSLLTSLNNAASTVLSVVTNPLSIIGNALGSLFKSTNGSRGGVFTRKKIIAIPGGFRISNITNQLTGQPIKGRTTGYTIGDGDKYGNDVGPDVDGSLEHSDMLVQFSYYATPGQNYDSKFDDALSNKVQTLTNDLKSVIDGINSNQTIYTAKLPTVYSKLLSSGDPKSVGYDNLFGSVPVNDSTPTNTFGVAGEYNSGNSNLPPTLDRRVNPANNLRFATTFTSDGINQLGVLSMKNGRIQIPWKASLSSQYPNWTEYKPYNDDLIAFFFYDLVNKKYIPFRATVKGISEGNTAFWDELRFIGRADQLYNYNGFSRTLSFSFNVVINSISELLPCWKRIAYIASAVKPSNYTRSETINNVFDRFMVPPMFQITIGDLYRYQPIVIRSINVNIPDDAIWETLNQDNSKEWTYLNGIIKNPSLNRNYGQLPREIEINIEGALLEKERAQVGGAHFGHAPRKDNWEQFLNSDGELTEDAFVVGAPGTEAGASYLKAPTSLHQSLITPLPSATPVGNTD